GAGYSASGSGDGAVINLSYTKPLQVTVTDKSGNPLAGAVVVFQTPTTGASGTFAGHVTRALAVTGSDGIATAPTFTANTTAGSYKVTAAVEGVGSIAFTLTNLPLPPGTLTFDVQPSNTSV